MYYLSHAGLTLLHSKVHWRRKVDFHTIHGTKQSKVALVQNVEPKGGYSMKRRIKFRWLIILLIIAVAGFFVVRGVVKRRQAASQAASMAFGGVEVTRQDLEVMIDTSGKINPSGIVDIISPIAGQISELLVEAGKPVVKGQIVARIDPSDAEQLVKKAQNDLKIAESKLRTAKLTASQAPAKAKMQVDRAKSALASAQLRYDQLIAGPTKEALAQAESSLKQAQLSLESAQTEYERMVRLYEAQAVTKQQLDSALSKYESAKESLKSAQAKLDDLNAPPLPEELAAAEHSLAQAKIDLQIAEEDLKSVDQNDSLMQAEIAYNEAQSAYDSAVRDLQATVIKAPISGMVTQVQIKEGTYVTDKTVLMSISDTSGLIVEATVDEYDVVKVKPGMACRVIVEPLGGATFNGELIFVGAAGSEQGGVVLYPVKVALLNPGNDVKIGMNADIEIVVAEQSNVLCVPNAALETRKGQSLVRILESDGSISMREVTIGLQTETMTEIISGLQEGEKVAVPGVNRSQNQRIPTNNMFRMGIGGSAPVGGRRP
jgi:HlyD family secretion protein